MIFVCIIHRKMFVIESQTNERMDPKEHYPQTANRIALLPIEFRSHCTIFSVEFLPCDWLDLIYLWRY